MRRFTRLTNAFSKKIENHAHMVALYALWYNFVKIHKTLKMTPAMAAGWRQRPALVDGRRCRAGRGVRAQAWPAWPYKKRAVTAEVGGGAL